MHAPQALAVLKPCQFLGPLSGALPPPAAPFQQLATTDAEEAITATDRCQGELEAVDVTALFFRQAPTEVILLVGETATHLKQLPGASGARDGGGNEIFWIKGDRATWHIGMTPAMQCGPME